MTVKLSGLRRNISVHYCQCIVNRRRDVTIKTGCTHIPLGRNILLWVRRDVKGHIDCTSGKMSVNASVLLRIRI